METSDFFAIPICIPIDIKNFFEFHKQNRKLIGAKQESEKDRKFVVAVTIVK